MPVTRLVCNIWWYEWESCCMSFESCSGLIWIIDNVVDNPTAVQMGVNPPTRTLQPTKQHLVSDSRNEAYHCRHRGAPLLPSAKRATNKKNWHQTTPSWWVIHASEFFCLAAWRDHTYLFVWEFSKSLSLPVRAPIRFLVLSIICLYRIVFAKAFLVVTVNTSANSVETVLVHNPLGGGSSVPSPLVTHASRDDAALTISSIFTQRAVVTAWVKPCDGKKRPIYFWFDRCTLVSFVVRTKWR